jgi:TPR repeat protein
MPSTRLLLRSLASVALFQASCASLGGGSPDTPSAADVTGRATVVPVAGPTVPFIVDWKPEDRGDLEEAVADGVAVIAFDQAGLRLLKRCHLRGDYGYLPLEPKKDVVRFESAVDVSANLPVGGPSLAAKIGGGFAQGKTLDLAYIMIGKRRTTWTDPTTADLDGKCEGATHYVRAMTVGAFAMSTGAREKVSAAADVFAATASASSGASTEIASTDGNLAACMTATSDSDAPPPGCRSLLRLELEPIARGAASPASGSGPNSGPPAERSSIAGAQRIDCGPGLVFSGDRCIASEAAAQLPHFCNPDDVIDCDAQCARGDAASCAQAGYLLAVAPGGVVDGRRVDGYFERGCQGEIPSACLNLGLHRLAAAGGGPSSIDALKPIQRACKMGEARACSVMGESFLLGSNGVARDPKVAVKYYSAGCNGGDTDACTSLSVLLMGGGGAEVPIDRPLAGALSARACNGGDATACGNAGLMFEFGMGVPLSIPRARDLFHRACDLSADACLRLGIIYQHGIGYPRDDAGASAQYDKACRANGTVGSSFPSLACHVNARMYGAPEQPLDRKSLGDSLTIMAPQCEQKVARACSFLGVALHALGRGAESEAALQKGCELADPWACDLRKRMRR